MNRLSLQWRLTVLSAVLLAISCSLVFIFISNSALMKMDQIEENVISIELTDSDEAINLGIGDLIPGLRSSIAKTKQTFRIQCIFITIGVILLGSVLTWFVSGMVLKPLRELTTEIGNISEADLSQDLPVPHSDDEISALTRSFNRMLHRLDGAFRSQKQFSANAAHELRTPLAVLQTNLEVFRKRPNKTAEDYDAIIDQTLTQTDRLSNLVNSLLELLSLHTVSLEDEIQLYALTEEILCDLEPLAEKDRITFTLSGTECTIRGNDGLIYRAVYNLIENAIKYNRPDGTVSVQVQDGTVTVRDTGSGIPKEDRERIFEPFYRVDKARSRKMGGAGLGLALVSDIAAVHEGSVRVTESSENGTVIELKLKENENE